MSQVLESITKFMDAVVIEQPSPRKKIVKWERPKYFYEIRLVSSSNAVTTKVHEKDLNIAIDIALTSWRKFDDYSYSSHRFFDASYSMDSAVLDAQGRA